jgi:hypothetical protein
VLRCAHHLLQLVSWDGGVLVPQSELHDSTAADKSVC